jgi:hypothetical protein
VAAQAAEVDRRVEALAEDPGEVPERQVPSPPRAAGGPARPPRPPCISRGAATSGASARVSEEAVRPKAGGGDEHRCADAPLTQSADPTDAAVAGTRDLADHDGLLPGTTPGSDVVTQA